MDAALNVGPLLIMSEVAGSSSSATLRDIHRRALVLLGKGAFEQDEIRELKDTVTRAINNCSEST